MAIAAVVRALWGYFFLVFLVRIVGRRPGKQITPFEFVLVFFLGGLMLTGVVGNEKSLTNAVCQIITVAAAHFVLVWMRSRWPRMARLLDGTALILLEGGYWRERTLSKMRISRADVMSVARDRQLHAFSDVDAVVLERNGEISVIARKED